MAYNIDEAIYIPLQDLDKYPDHVKWISLSSPAEDEINSIASLLDLHPLVIEDMMQGEELPKVNEYPKYTFIITDILEFKEDELIANKLYMVLGKDFLMTLTEDIDTIRFVQNLVVSKARNIIEQGPDFLAYTFLDRGVDKFYPVLDEIEDIVMEVEDLVIEQPDKWILNVMTDVRRDLLIVRKSAWLIREVISSLMRGSSPFITPRTVIYLRDVYDHIIQTMELVETYRDILVSSRDTYMSSVSNSLNEVMKQLTIIATIMLPLSFIASVYGMNFKFMPELEWEYGYFAVLGFMILLTAIMIAYFRKKKWI
ncbi:magnesium/cobalt transporter CorA [Methanooceanicella nereidis]|nr:magnesium/cobalt transporter CorA [Methanocella sp. CWC-04]